VTKAQLGTGLIEVGSAERQVFMFDVVLTAKTRGVSRSSRRWAPGWPAPKHYRRSVSMALKPPEEKTVLERYLPTGD